MSILANQSSILGSELTDDVEVALLSAVDDDHGGVIVELKEPMDPAAFHTSLRASISNWRKQVIFSIMDIFSPLGCPVFCFSFLGT